MDRRARKIFWLDCPHLFEIIKIDATAAGMVQSRVDSHPICIQSSAENKSVNT